MLTRRQTTHALHRLLLTMRPWRLGSATGFALSGGLLARYEAASQERFGDCLESHPHTLGHGSASRGFGCNVRARLANWMDAVHESMTHHRAHQAGDESHTGGKSCLCRVS